MRILCRKKGGIVFDVGANVGNYTKMVLEIMGDKLEQVHLFEPMPSTYQTLCENVKNKKCVINNWGLSDKKCQQEIYYDSPKSGLASLYKRQLDYINIELSNCDTVCLQTLDDYCREKK